MGTDIRFNSVLKLDENQIQPNIAIGNRYTFQLSGKRIFQLHPVILPLVKEVNKQWIYIGMITITHETIDAEKDITFGEYLVHRKFQDELIPIITNMESPDKKSYFSSET